MSPRSGLKPLDTVGESSSVYTQTNVAIRPGGTARGSLNGALSLVRDAAGSALFLCWLPEARVAAEAPQAQQYAVHPIAVTSVRSLKRRTPTLGYHFLLVALSSGVSLPPLYFHSGGTRRFLDALAEHHPGVTRDDDDPNTYYVDADDADAALQRSLSSLLDAAPASPACAASPGLLSAASRLASSFFAGADDRAERGRRSCPGPLAARDAAGLEATSLGVFELVEGDAAAEPPPWRQPRPPPLSAHEWAALRDADGRVADAAALSRRVFYGGVESDELRRAVWPVLLGSLPGAATDAERRDAAAQAAREYAALRLQWESVSERQARRFSKFRERRARVDKDVRRTDAQHPFFADNAEHQAALRRILLSHCFWDFDLGYCQGMSDLAAPLLVVLGDEAQAFWAFAALLERGKMAANFDRDQRGMHAQLTALRRVVRAVDPQLHEHILAADAQKMVFCFRWVLIAFKRELPYAQVLRLWEAMFSGFLGDGQQLLLLVCAAVLTRHRESILRYRLDQDGLIIFCNALSIDLDLALRDAEMLRASLGSRLETLLSEDSDPDELD